MVHILLLQEIKDDGFQLSTSLNTILPNYHQIILASDEGRGGAALIIHPKFRILHDRSIPKLMAWVQVDGPLGSFFMGSVYRTDSSLDRASLWKTLNDNLLGGSWLIGGDFNFTKERQDSNS